MASRILGASALVVLLVLNTAPSETKDYPKLISGKWKVTKADPETVPVGAVFDFLADGKLKFRYSADGQELELNGRYKLEGTKLTITVQFGDEEKSQNVEVTQLDQKTLALLDPDKRTVELRRP